MKGAVELESIFNIFGILYVIFSLAIGFGFVFGIAYLIYKLATKKHTRKPKKIYLIMPFVSALVAVAAFIFNMGWFRVALIVYGIAPIHAILFLFSSLYSSDSAAENTPLRFYTIISYITYPLPYMLLPDGGDAGEEYMFFWLIKNEQIINIGYALVLPCFIISAVFIALQFFKARKLRTLSHTTEDTIHD